LGHHASRIEQQFATGVILWAYYLHWVQSGAVFLAVLLAALLAAWLAVLWKATAQAAQPAQLRQQLKLLQIKLLHCNVNSG
jgi:hypothetical protein